MPNGIINSNQIVDAVGVGFNPTKSKMVIWNHLKLWIHPMLSLEAAVCFVDNVVDACYVYEICRPEMLDFAVRVNTVYLYAGVELPNNIDKQYEIVYGTDLFDTVVQHINKDQLSSLRCAAESIVNQMI